MRVHRSGGVGLFLELKENETMAEKIAAGVIGTGFIGPVHVEAGRRLGNVEFVALAEANAELARSKADLLSIEKSYGDYRELLADPQVRVVHNCTPNHLHYQVNKDILAAGKHVISEKPLAMNSTESRELVQLASESGLIHAVDFNYRYYPLVQHARQMVQQGELGEVFTLRGSYLQDWLYLQTDWNWRLQPEMSGDSRAVADVGSHWCDLLQFITGESIVRVMADLQTVHKTRMKPKKQIETYAGKELSPSDYEPQDITTEDYASVLIELSGGARGVFCQPVSAGRKIDFRSSLMVPAVHWPGIKKNQMRCGSVIEKKPMKSWSKILPFCTKVPESTPITQVVIPRPIQMAPRIYSATYIVRLKGTNARKSRLEHVCGWPQGNGNL